MPMDECLRNYRKFTQCSTCEAIAAASTTPAALAFGPGTLHGTLRPGAPAELVLLSDALEVRAVFRAGRRVWPLSPPRSAVPEGRLPPICAPGRPSALPRGEMCDASLPLF
jgi:hypothetical protein